MRPSLKSRGFMCVRAVLIWPESALLDPLADTGRAQDGGEDQRGSQVTTTCVALNHPPFFEALSRFSYTEQPSK